MLSLIIEDRRNHKVDKRRTRSDISCDKLIQRRPNYFYEAEKLRTGIQTITLSNNTCTQNKDLV